MLQYDLEAGTYHARNTLVRPFVLSTSAGTLGHGELPPLPQEIWDAILRNLRHEKCTLSACNLVCRSWRYTARQLLWRDVRVRHPIRLSLTVQRYPEVLPMIQILRFDIHREYEDFSWMPRLSNLSVLVISLEDEDRGALATNIHPGLRVLSVTSLTLIGYSWSRAAFLRIVGCFPHLQELHVDGPTAVDSDGFLDLDGPRPAYGPLLSLSHLRKLKVNALHLLTLLPRILKSASASMEQLCLEVSTHVPLPALSSALDLSHNTRLTRVSVITNFHYMADNWGDYVACPLAKVGSAHTTLTDVSLHWTAQCAPRSDRIPRHHASGPPSTDYPDPGPTLGRELSRVLDELPRVKVTFWQKDGVSQSYATKARRGTAKKLLQSDPDLLAHSERVKWRWTCLVGCGTTDPSAYCDSYGGSALQPGQVRNDGLSKSLGPLDLFDI